MYSTYQYTSILDSQFQRRTSQLRSFYCREDFAGALTRYRKAKKDAKPFRRNDLEQMCRARQMDCEQLIHNDALLAEIPTRQEMKEQLLEIFYDLYAYAPSAAAYMERIVRRLAPEYDGDPVRTVILKKFVAGGGPDFATYDTKAVIDWAVSRMSPEARAQYQAASGEEKLVLAVNQLDDSIFTPERLSAELTAREMLELMRWRWERLAAEIEALQTRGLFSRPDNRARQQLRNFCKVQGIDFSADDSEDDLEERITEQIRTFCVRCHIPGGEKADFIGALRVILDTLAQSQWEQLPAGAMAYISACFWLLMRRTTYRNRNKQEATADNLFKTDVRDAERRKQGKQWELLRLCDNLASGSFKSNNGNTRIWLYQLAIMFSMTIALAWDEERDPKRDAVKNLFEDYYSDNMARFLDSSFDDPKFASTQEREPGGEGVNLKNFAEAIYVYYLYRTDLPLTPGQRIDHAEKKIRQCLDRVKKAPTVMHPVGRRDYTSVYEYNLLNEMIDAGEEQLVAWITNHYHISAQAGARVTQASDTNTAFDIMSNAMEEIEEGSEYVGGTPPDYGDNADARELARTLIDDMKLQADYRFTWALTPLLVERYGDNPGFVRAVTNITQRLSVEVESSGIRQINLLSNVLHCLCLHSSMDEPIGLEALKKSLYAQEAALTGDQLTQCIQTLAELGFDVQRLSGKSESLFCLGQRDYEDETRKRIMELVQLKNRYYDPERDTLRRELFAELLEQCGYENRKVTRTTLVAVLTRNYISSIQDRYDLNSLPELYDDFTATINPDLSVARFQPLNEKNMLDMYVILSVYLYLIENGKGDHF